MGLCSGMNKTNKRWNKEEEDYIRANWGVVKVTEMAEKLNRTTEGVYRKATRLKLKMTDSQYESVTDKIRWTNSMKEYVKDNYGKVPIEDMMEHLQVFSKGKIRRQAKFLGVAEKAHIWTPEEEIYLTSNWGEVSIKRMAHNIKVTEYAILQKAHKLKLGNQIYYSGDWYAVPTIAEILGIGKRAIYVWINAGILKSKKLQVGKTYRVRIKYNNLINFLRENKELYDTKNCDIELLKTVIARSLISKTEKLKVHNMPTWLEEKIEEDRNKPITYKPRDWTKLEEKRLIELYNDSKTYKEMCKILNRSRDSIGGRLKQLRKSGIIK